MAGTTHDKHDLIILSGKIRGNLSQALDRLNNADEALDGDALLAAADLIDRVEIYTSAINSLIANSL